MFTGIVECMGVVKEIRTRGNCRVMSIGSSLPPADIQVGESIACDGACLTVVAVRDDVFVVEASQETAARTILPKYETGRNINVERALQVGSRLGGHFVSGHIDDTGMVDYMKPVGESWKLAVRYDRKYDPLVIEKGSIAINGVSLTVNESRSGWLAVNVIPHTVTTTALGELKSGNGVNLEFDLIGKYILRMTDGGKAMGLTKDKLQESGW
jgi:riboflavin synthase